MVSDHIGDDRELVDKALRESEERYRAFIANSSEGIWRFEIEQPIPTTLSPAEQIDAYYKYGYLAECNDAMARMYGYEKAEEIVGARLGDLLVRDNPNNIAHLETLIYSGYRLSDAESSEVDREGRQKYFANNLFGIVENGRLCRIWGTQRDVTERKRTEQRIAILYSITRVFAEKGTAYNAAEDILKLICESLGWAIGAFWQVDKEAGRLKCLAFWRQPALDVSEFESVTRSTAFGPNEGLPGTVWQTGEPLWVTDFSQAFRFPRAPLAAHAGIGAAVCFPLVLHGEIVGVMEFFSHDIKQPDRPLLELMDAVGSQVAQLIEHGHAEQARRDSEERYRTLAETASDGIITVDDSSTILFVNEAAGKVFGYTRDEMTGRCLTMLMPEYLRHLHRAGITRYADTGERHIPWDGIELPGLHKDGREIPLEISFGESRLEGKHLFTGIVRDISERKSTEAMVQESLEREQHARQRAEEASRLKDEFLATVSHELRTPLTAVMGWSHILLTSQLDAERGRDALDAIARNARAQTRLIDDLLDVSRIITGSLRLDVRTIDPVTCVEAAIEAVRPAAEAKGVRLQKVIDNGAGSVAGDPQRLQQVVWNLLSNAIKFTPRNGRVQVRLERVDSSIEISVADTGSGIEPEFLPYVFDRFRQADMSTTRRHGGLGLGLAIVRHLIELHGGTVHAESEGERRGCTFRVRLPVVAVHETAKPPSDRSSSLAIELLDAPDRLDNLKVLLVDDEQDTLTMLSTMLEHCGARVLTADSTTGALELFEREQPDIVVSDIGMPVEDGYVLIRKIRALDPERGGRIPAVALTAYARPEDRLRALRAGYQMHIPKPVDAAELVAIIASMTARAPSG